MLVNALDACAGAAEKLSTQRTFDNCVQSKRELS